MTAFIKKMPVKSDSRESDFSYFSIIKCPYKVIHVNQNFADFLSRNCLQKAIQLNQILTDFYKEIAYKNWFTWIRFWLYLIRDHKENVYNKFCTWVRFWSILIKKMPIINDSRESNVGGFSKRKYLHKLTHTNHIWDDFKKNTP